MQNWKKGYVFGHINKFWRGRDAQMKKNTCKNMYLGSIFIPEKCMFRVCFGSPFTRMISSQPPPPPPCTGGAGCIEYRSDDIPKNLLLLFRFWIPCIGGAWIPNQPHWNQCNLAMDPNCYEPGQFILISVALIRYSCGHISSHHEAIHVKFGVWGFFIMLNWNMVMKMLKCIKENLVMSHFSTL